MWRFRPERKFHLNNVIVGGGNVAGGVASIVLGKAGLSVLCVDKIDPLEEQIPSCNGCGGLIQERTAQTLEKLGVPVEKATRRKLDGFIVTLPTGEEMVVKTPMRSVYRGHGPLHDKNKKPGLDALILQTALKYPTVSYHKGKIVDVDLSSGKEALVYLDKMHEPLKSDFFVGAFGHNSELVKKHIKVPDGQKLDAPKTQKSTVMEIAVGDDILKKHFGSYARVLVLPYDKTKKDSNVLFVALIPKDNGSLTMIVMGDGDVTPEDTHKFISSPYLADALPNELVNKIRNTSLVKDGGCKLCSCSRNTITVASPEHYLISGMGGGIMIGDTGLTRLYKDGIGAAVTTAEAAAKAIITGDFTHYQRLMEKEFPPDDHIYADGFLRLNDAIIANSYLRNLLLAGKGIPGVSHLLIDPFMRHFLTGDVAYKNIFPHKLSEMLFQIFGI